VSRQEVLCRGSRRKRIKNNFFILNNTTKNILSVVAGTLTGFCLGAVLIYVCNMSITEKWGIAGFLLGLVIGFLIPAFFSGAVCGYIANNKPYLNLFVTSLLLILVLLINNDFKGFVINIQTLASAALGITFVFIGGEYGMFLKKKSAR
jgi:hypothetical protein